MFGGCKTMFDRIKGRKTAKKISNFFLENYDPINDSMFTPKKELDINIDSPETLKFIKEITLFLNDESRSNQLGYTIERLSINDLIKWACLIKEIIENYDTNSNKYMSFFYNKITEKDANYLYNFLSKYLIDKITSRVENMEDGDTKGAYQRIIKGLKLSAPNNNSIDNPIQEEIFQSTPSDKFIRKLKKILDSAYLPIKRSKSNIAPADLETYKKIASILPDDDKYFDNAYSKFVAKVGNSELIRRCILDENYRKKFSPKQLVKLQRYYDLSGESTNQHNEQDKIYRDIDQNILNEEIPNGAITFDPRYKNNKNISYISSEPIVNANGFATLHDIGKDGNQQDIGKPPIIEAHTSSNTGGSSLEITHCFFRVKATELDTDSVANENLNNKENSEKSIIKRALKRKSYSFGYYPNLAILDSISPKTDSKSYQGKLVDDHNHYSQLAVARICDNKKILKMDKSIHEFTRKNTYSLFSSNCTAFVSKISNSIGFRDISKMFGGFIFAPNIAAKNIASSWTSGKYDNDEKTIFKTPSHKMKIYKIDNNNYTEESKKNERFYSKYNDAIHETTFIKDNNKTFKENIKVYRQELKKNFIMNMENMKTADNDDISYSTVKDYLINFIGRFYDELPEQGIEFAAQLAHTLLYLKALFDLAKCSNKQTDIDTLRSRKLEAKEQLNLLGNVFSTHNNYRGFLFVKFLIKRIDSGLIEMQIEENSIDPNFKKDNDIAWNLYKKNEGYYNTSVKQYNYFKKVYAQAQEKNDMMWLLRNQFAEKSLKEELERTRTNKDKAYDDYLKRNKELKEAKSIYYDMLKKYHEDSIN